MGWTTINCPICTFKCIYWKCFSPRLYLLLLERLAWFQNTGIYQHFYQEKLSVFHDKFTALKKIASPVWIKMKKNVTFALFSCLSWVLNRWHFAFVITCYKIYLRMILQQMVSVKHVTYFSSHWYVSCDGGRRLLYKSLKFLKLKPSNVIHIWEMTETNDVNKLISMFSDMFLDLYINFLCQTYSKK